METKRQETAKPEGKKLAKVVRLGAVECWTRPADIFARVEYDGTRLSIVGVIGPKSDGDARGGCGQIDPAEETFTNYAPGWDAEKVAEFARIWKRWHLNDMRAGCEHQRANWPSPSEQVEVVTYKLTTDALIAQNRVRSRIAQDMTALGKCELTAEERELYALPYTTTQTPDADGPTAGRYEVKTREQKAIGWLGADEHPRGILGKPCEVCGYKYGHAWLTEEIPAEVIAWLSNLPDTDTTPAWV